jgi:hypothetical protein
VFKKVAAARTDGSRPLKQDRGQVPFRAGALRRLCAFRIPRDREGGGSMDAGDGQRGRLRAIFSRSAPAAPTPRGGHLCERPVANCVTRLCGEYQFETRPRALSKTFFACVISVAASKLSVHVPASTSTELHSPGDRGLKRTRNPDVCRAS